MLLHKVLHYSQSQTGPLLRELGRVKRIEDLLLILHLKTAAVIPDFEENIVVIEDRSHLDCLPMSGIAKPGAATRCAMNFGRSSPSFPTAGPRELEVCRSNTMIARVWMERG